MNRRSPQTGKEHVTLNLKALGSLGPAKQCKTNPDREISRRAFVQIIIQADEVHNSIRNCGAAFQSRVITTTGLPAYFLHHYILSHC